MLLGGREFTWRVVYNRTWSIAVELSLASVPMGEAVVDSVTCSLDMLSGLLTKRLWSTLLRPQPEHNGDASQMAWKMGR